MKRFIQLGLMICITVMVVTLGHIRIMKERMEIAYQAFKIEKTCPDNYMHCIDFSKPVRIYYVEKGERFIQYHIPGDPQGNFYALENATPSELGISDYGYDPNMKLNVPKVKTVYVAVRNFKMLGSYAAPIIDDWSTPQDETQTKGSALQYFTTCKQCFEKEIENDK